MAIFDKAKEKFQGFMQGSEQANRNRRSNGGTSGYRPVRNQNTPQPQQEVPAGAFGGGVMPDTMFGGNAGFESVAATGRQNPSGAAPQQTAKHRPFQDLLNRALGKQDKQSGTQRQQPVQEFAAVKIHKDALRALRIPRSRRSRRAMCRTGRGSASRTTGRMRRAAETP